MAEFWRSFNPSQTGWTYMWIIALVGAVAVAVMLERAFYIYVKSNIDANKFMAQIRKWVTEKDYKRAIALCSRFKDKALPKIVLAGLVKARSMKSPSFRAIQNAVDEGTLEIIPRLQARTHFLAMFGNISTLLGLMGTIYGLILAFHSVGVPGLDAAEKSTRLAQGISVAMNTTLEGLAIAIPSILVYTILHNKTIRIIDEIDEHTVKLINLMTEEE